MNAVYGRALGSPSGGMVATARGMALLAGSFLINGDWLSPESRELMTTSQTGKLPGGFDGVREWPVCPWGLGWEVKGPKQPHWTGDRASAATFGHTGQSGAMVWADPETGVACAVLANRDIGSGWSEGPDGWSDVNDAMRAGFS